MPGDVSPETFVAEGKNQDMAAFGFTQMVEHHKLQAEATIPQLPRESKAMPQ